MIKKLIILYIKKQKIEKKNIYINIFIKDPLLNIIKKTIDILNNSNILKYFLNNSIKTFDYNTSIFKKKNKFIFKNIFKNKNLYSILKNKKLNNYIINFNNNQNINNHLSIREFKKINIQKLTIPINNIEILKQSLYNNNLKFIWNKFINTYEYNPFFSNYLKNINYTDLNKSEADDSISTEEYLYEILNTEELDNLEYDSIYTEEDISFNFTLKFNFFNFENTYSIFYYKISFIDYFLNTKFYQNIIEDTQIITQLPYQITYIFNDKTNKDLIYFQKIYYLNNLNYFDQITSFIKTRNYIYFLLVYSLYNYYKIQNILVNKLYFEILSLKLINFVKILNTTIFEIYEKNEIIPFKIIRIILDNYKKNNLFNNLYFIPILININLITKIESGIFNSANYANITENLTYNLIDNKSDWVDDLKSSISLNSMLPLNQGWFKKFNY